VLLDLNCRPEAIADEPAYRARLREVLHHADVIKASEEDLAYLEPDRVPLAAARDLLSLGPKVVLLTRGGRGAAVIAAVGEATVSAPAARVLDTIGAGDAFGAAWLGAWIAEGLCAGDLGRLDPVISAAQFAATVASRTCASAGAGPPYAVKVDSEWCFASAHAHPDTIASPQ
jgi:fructokinase